MASGLVDLFKHNAWANERLFRALEPLDAAILKATVPGTYDNVWETLRHIAWAQHGYLTALTGETPMGRPDRIHEMAEIGELLRQSSEGFIKVAAEIPADRVLHGKWRGEPFTLPAWHFYIQAINHATEHRSQIATILTQQGITPPEMDGWNYLEEMADR
jgi:uncharacterized damage-inducible protein DinB